MNDQDGIHGMHGIHEDGPSRGRRLAPWVLSAALLLAWAALRLIFMRGAAPNAIMGAVVALALLGAAFQHDRRDPPFWAWLALGLALTITEFLIGLRDWEFLAAFAHWWQAPFVLVNLLLIAAILTFVRNVRASGLVPPWSLPWKVGTAVATGIAGTTATILIRAEFLRWQSDGAGFALAELSGLAANGSSAVGDATMFIGAVLLARMVLPMRGGSFARPYLLLCLAGAAFLALDVFTVWIAAGAPDWVADVGTAAYGVADGALLVAALNEIWLARRA